MPRTEEGTGLRCASASGINRSTAHRFIRRIKRQRVQALFLRDSAQAGPFVNLRCLFFGRKYSRLPLTLGLPADEFPAASPILFGDTLELALENAGQHETARRF